MDPISVLQMVARDYLLYCIRASRASPKTYIGITNNFKRRLRQHRGIIKGGARFTRGCSTWTPTFHVRGLTKREALQLEWAVKHKRYPGVAGPEGRLLTVRRLLTKVERWTSNSPRLRDIRHHLKLVHFVRGSSQQ